MDMMIIFFTGWFAYFIRFQEFNFPSSYLSAFLIASLSTPIMFSFFNIYKAYWGDGIFKYMIRLMQAVLVLACMLSGLSFFTKSGDQFSRSWFMIWMGFALFFLVFFRSSLILLLRFMRTLKLNERRVVIFGAGKLGKDLAGSVQQALWTGFRIVGFLDDKAETKPPFIAKNISVIKTPTNLGQYLKDQGVDEIWLALPLHAEARVKEILYELRHETITTRFVLDIIGLDLWNHSITHVAGFPVLNIKSTPMVGINRIIKAFEDRIIATIILTMISPLLLIIAILVKLDSKGPIFFKQHRLGWDGRIITVYKFRTMKVHTEQQGTLTQATVDDMRVTRLGRFLRRTSLDELPQFINVLQGRMSIVGPRPHALMHNEMYKEAIHTYMQRHRVKPGITGWAQVNGWRGETDTLDKMQKRVEYDLYYINNWSLTFDLKIILLTLLRGFINRNAY
jgi:putative colanic acid biosynthesis UDP-glucose lipid carrier transferase